MVRRRLSLRNGKRGVRRADGIGFAAAVFLLCIVGVTLSGCKKQEQKVEPERAVNVRVWTAESRSLRPFVESIGTLNPYETVNISSELDGILQAIRVDEGSIVTSGQLIAEIKETDYRLALEQAAAVLKQAEAALANAKLEHQRKEALYREELVTKQQYDDVVARLALTQGDVERAKAGVDLAKERLTKTKIFAPMAGSVKEKKVTAGDYVRNGTFMVSLIRTDQLKLVFAVPEKDVGKLQAGQDVVFTVDAFPGREFHGQVKTIHPGLEERTRSLQVEAEVKNVDQRLKPGLFARVTLYTGPARDTVVVPINAIQYDNSTTKLFVVAGNRAKERKVKIGRKYGELTEITEGLRAKEVVVTVGQNNLMEGVLVNVAR